MDNNTGYVIAEDNYVMLAHITGMEQKLLKANVGWCVIFNEEWMPFWKIMPVNVAKRLHNFQPVDSIFNGLPARSREEIIKERSELNASYSKKLKELNDEMARAKMRDEGKR